MCMSFTVFVIIHTNGTVYGVGGMFSLLLLVFVMIGRQADIMHTIGING